MWCTRCLQLLGGLLHYVDSEQIAVLDTVSVNDGRWHYVETRWAQTGQLIISLDHGLFQVSDALGADWAAHHLA